MKKFNIKLFPALFVLIILFSTITFAANSTALTKLVLFSNVLFSISKNIMLPLVIIGFVVASVIYIGGYVLDSEMEASARGWSLRIIAYIAIGSIIFLVIPFAITSLIPGTNVVGPIL